MPIPAGITRQDVLDAIAYLKANPSQGFGESTGYDLVHDDRSYPPKAVVGYAARRVRNGEVLPNNDFSGGDSPGAANPLLRSFGFVIVAKVSQTTTVPGDSDLVRATLDNVVEEWRAIGQDESWAHSEGWLVNRPAVLDAIDRLRANSDIAAFATAIGALPKSPPWVFRGPLRILIGTFAGRPPTPDTADVLVDVFTAPLDETEAARKITALRELANATENMFPAPGYAPLGASIMWCFQDPSAWPWLSAEAEPGLFTLRLLPRELPPDERYLAYRRMIQLSSAPPTETVYALARAGTHGTRSISAAVQHRLRDNSQLLVDHTERGQYESEAERSRAERNIDSVLGEFDLLARGMSEEIAERLVRPLVTSKTDSRIGYDAHLPFRADGYSIFAIERNMSMPSIRVWATKNGVAVGAHFGAGKKYESTAAMALQLLPDLSDQLQFFEVLPHKTGDRLRPADSQPQRGELFVGEWFPDGLSGPESGDRVMRAVARLQPVFDAMVAATGEAPTPQPQGDDPLEARVQRFLFESGYPTEADRTNKAERELMEKVISEEGLLAFDLPEFRRIYNTSRYGNPGPQSILNASLGQMTVDQLDTFARNIDFLLRGAASVEERINSVLDPSDRGVKGLGEAVIAKLLAIAHPDRFIPIFPYRGEKGKAPMLARLDLHANELDQLDRGSRLVRSNDLLRDRLAPFFHDDTHGMKVFLYWLADQPAEEEGDGVEPIDRIGNLADDVLLDRAFLDELVSLLKSKGQIVFYGPPGTGKTYVARELAKALAPDAAHRMLVQFHPSTSYEDFFEGYRPETDSHGNLTYTLTKGPLALLAERAKENPSRQYVMVIDEINRANLPKVLGEMLFLLEYRDESVRSLYRPDDPFELPKNLWFIGTMNTADRSVGLIDAALRRRFHFVPFFPHEEPLGGLLRRWLTQHHEPDWVADLLDLVNEELRARLGGPHLQIGPSHFMKPGLTQTQVEQVWKYSIFPFVEEQLYGDEAGIRSFQFSPVMKRLRAKTGSAEDIEEDDVGSDQAPGMG